MLIIKKIFEVNLWDHYIDTQNFQILSTHSSLVTPYGDRDLGHHWLRWWLVAWQQQAITWINVDWS